MNWTKEEIAVVQRIEDRTESGEILSTLDTVWFWIKDMNFKFRTVTEEVAKILYNKTANECHRKSDFDLVKESGLKLDKNIFSKVCRGSDLYILNNAKKWIYNDTMFIEFLTAVDGTKHIWQTVKGIRPKEEGFWQSYFGNAVFLDRLLGYDNALESVKNMKKLCEINKNLFVYKK